MTLIYPDNSFFQYSGRIDFSEKTEPWFTFPYSSVRMRFSGKSAVIHVKNSHLYWDNYLGLIVDGEQHKLRLDNGSEEQIFLLDDLLGERSEHDVLLFKRQDACHMVAFCGLEIESDAQMLPLPAKPKRKIEVYGDSVSAGEVSEAVAYVGMQDPPHQGEYSNSWYSYAAIAARKLQAELHDIAQGGAALMDGIGWFREPDAIGMETIYKQVLYQPEYGPLKEWDFQNFRPQVVIVAVGQNDCHPDDFMASDPQGKEAERWKNHYERFIRELLYERHPDAKVILATTILNHHESWDCAIEEVCERISDSRLYHFKYRRNGSGTPGHIRIPEAEEMAEELVSFIEEKQMFEKCETGQVNESDVCKCVTRQVKKTE